MRIRNKATILRAQGIGWRPAEFRGRVEPSLTDLPSAEPILPDMSWAELRPIPLIEPSRASRVPRPKKRGSSVGWIVDPVRRRQIHYESGLEEQAITVLVADPDVVEVEEQLPPVDVQLVDGTSVKHWLDLRVTRRDGRRTGIAVKYAADVARAGLRTVLSAYAAQATEVDQHGRTVPVADTYTIMTERHLDAVRVGNARRVIACGADFDLEGQKTVRSWLEREAPCRFQLGLVGQVTGLGSRGFRAALALVQTGAILLPPTAVSAATEVGNGTVRGRTTA